MKSITIANLHLPASVGSKNLRQLRDDIVKIVGNEQAVWHGHTEDGGYDYDYPLIQYRHNRITGIGKAAKAIDALWEDHSDVLGMVQLEKQKINLAVTDVPQTYYIHRWFPLNADNYERWKTADPMSRLAELERILTANILTFARGVEWLIPEMVQVNILDVLNIKKNNMMNQKVPGWEETCFVSFGIVFQANVLLPLDIGLGRGVRLGNGVLEPVSHANKFVKTFDLLNSELL